VASGEAIRRRFQASGVWRSGHDREELVAWEAQNLPVQACRAQSGEGFAGHVAPATMSYEMCCSSTSIIV
jgi:hypothetical protein